MNLMIILIQVIALILGAQQTVDPSQKRDHPVTNKLGRVTIVATDNGKTVRTGRGGLLRGSAIFVSSMDATRGKLTISTMTAIGMRCGTTASIPFGWSSLIPGSDLTAIRDPTHHIPSRILTIKLTSPPCCAILIIS